MKYVQDEEYFHISSESHSHLSWKPGKTTFIGNTFNPFFNYYSHRKFYINLSDGQEFPLNEVAFLISKSISEQKNPPEWLQQAYHCNLQKSYQEVYDTWLDHIKLIRELIFEEVRQQFFSQLPSRQKCLWLIPPKHLRESLSFWESKLSSNYDNPIKIVELKLTGKIHIANENYLKPLSCSLNTLKQNAFKYWLGCDTTQPDDPSRLECIFEGFATVNQIYSSIDEFNKIF